MRFWRRTGPGDRNEGRPRQQRAVRHVEVPTGWRARIGTHPHAGGLVIQWTARDVLHECVADINRPLSELVALTGECVHVPRSAAASRTSGLEESESGPRQSVPAVGTHNNVVRPTVYFTRRERARASAFQTGWRSSESTLLCCPHARQPSSTPRRTCRLLSIRRSASHGERRRHNDICECP
jgi:hypothetical protein